MAKKEQLVGVVFQRSADGDASKEYLYKDSLGCKVGDKVVVEARDTIAIAKVVAIYVDTEKINERPIRNVVSKIESEYTKAQKVREDKAKRFRELDQQLRSAVFEEYSWLDIVKAVAKSDEKIEEMLTEYLELLTFFKEERENGNAN